MRFDLTSVLERRARSSTPSQRRVAWIASALIHLVLAAGVWASSRLQETPPPPTFVPLVRVVPPAALGAQRQPPPPPPPAPEPEPEVVPPPPPPPPPEPKPKKVEPKTTPKKEAPVIASKTKKPEPKPKPPPPSPVAPPPPPQLPEVPRRQGVLRGNPLGSSSSAAVGIEDPDFTFGYYLDTMVSHIGQFWTRPQISRRIGQTKVYYRIQRDGTITGLRLAESSGSTIFDDAALRAVQAAVPLPPLPRGYKKDYLGVTLVVE